MSLGKRLRSLRGDRTQLEIANKLGISRARYSHYETDHVQMDHDILCKIADVFDTSTDYLLGRTYTGISPEETNVIGEMRKLSEGDREILRLLISRFKNTKDAR